MRVRERFEPAEFVDEAPPTDGKQADGKRTGLRRTVTVTGPAPVAIAAWRLATGKHIEAVDGGWYVVDHAWRMRLNGTGADTIMRYEADGVVELRVPLVWTRTATAEQAVIEEELAW
jgi:hypothetical protein